MKSTTGWPQAVLGIRRRARWVAACYRSALTTFQVLRVLDQQALLASTSVAGSRRPFVARTGFVV